MSRCVIICAGEHGPINFTFMPDDFLICCDAGLSIARQMGLRPDLIIGDFDSLEQPLPDDIPVMHFPVEKDDTDSMLAVREGLRRGFDDFALLFSLGGRLDHTFSNLQTLDFILTSGAIGQLVGPQDEVHMIRNGTAEFPFREGYALSVFCWDGPAEGVTLRGVQYPLDGTRIQSSFPIGACNHIVAPQASVMVEHGTLLVICSRIQ